MNRIARLIAAFSLLGLSGIATPEDIHVVSRNASDTDPARFLVHILKTVGVPVTTPVP